MIFIEVVVPNAQIPTVEPFLMQCCTEVGDHFLGSRECPATAEHLFLVRLTEDPHLSKHLATLEMGLKNHLLTSFHFARGSVLLLSAPDIVELLQHFPFLSNDIWLSARDTEKAAYLCISRALLTAQQAAWLQLHPTIRWRYL